MPSIIRAPNVDGGVDISSGTWNSVGDAIDALDQRITQLANRPQVLPTGLLECRWKNTSDVVPGQTVGIQLSTSLISSPTTATDWPLSELLMSNLLDGNTASLAHSCGMWGVAKSVAKENDVVQVQMYGACYCEVEVSAEAVYAKYADVNASGLITLQPGGWARVLWKGASGTTRTALLLLGCSRLSWFGTKSSIITEGSIVELESLDNSGSMTVSHDVWSGNIPANTKCRVDFLAEDRLWHIVAWECP